MAITCPACGSTSVQQENELRSIEIPYGPPATFLEVVYSCRSCGESGDFTGENIQVIDKAIQKSTLASVIHMLDDLKKSGVSEVYLERALRLRLGVTKKWREGEATREAVALLRIVYTYPWLLTVSDSNFINPPKPKG